MSPESPRIAYLSLQAVVDGQDSWAAVNEIVGGWEAFGWTVERFYPNYRAGRPNPFVRLAEMYHVQSKLAARIDEFDALYVRAHPMAGMAVHAARRASVPVVQECNGSLEDLFIAWPITRLARQLFEWLQYSQYADASSIIAVTDGLHDWLSKATSNPRIVTIGNGANLDLFNPDAPRRAGLPERYAVFFGQFAEWQGIGVLLDALERPEWPEDVAVVFVGDGAERSAVQAAAADNPGRVVYTGRLPYAEVAMVVAHAIASFVPIVANAAEMLHSPLKLYESMACGVPLIASDTPGVAEVVREEACGVLVEPGDAAGLASALRHVAENPTEAADMGSRGRVAAQERYSWSARSRQRREVLAAAIEARQSGSVG